MRNRGKESKYSKEAMAAAIKDYETSKLSQKEVCEKHGITIGPFQYAWKRHKEMMKDGDKQGN